MAITGPMQEPSKGPEKSPVDTVKKKNLELQKQRKELQKEHKEIQKTVNDINKDFGKLFKTADVLRRLAMILAQDDPNDDPQELYRQVLPLLRRMGIDNMADRSKTEIVPGRTEGDKSLFKITLRRNAVITDDTIERLKRFDDNFEDLRWSAAAMELYVWWPYEAPQEATPAGAPPAP